MDTTTHLMQERLDALEDEVRRLRALVGEEVLTEDDAAVYLGISRESVYRLRRAGELRCAHVAGRPRYLRRDIDEYVRSRTVRRRA